MDIFNTQIRTQHLLVNHFGLFNGSRPKKHEGNHKKQTCFYLFETLPNNRLNLNVFKYKPIKQIQKSLAQPKVNHGNICTMPQTAGKKHQHHGKRKHHRTIFISSNRNENIISKPSA